MPDLEENEAIWSHEWDWSAQGDEWSSWWGGTPAVWHGVLMPRIHAFLPAGTVLEIAPGYGRWTQYLKELADRLVVIDMTERCIEHCRTRFADDRNIEYHVNDGRSLAAVADGSIDFAFSYDSLVHVEADVLAGYITQLADKLSADGAAFLHHSNAGTYPLFSRLARRAPDRLLMPLVHRGLLINIPAWRAESVTARYVAEHCRSVGLVAYSQELINWEHGRYLIDALTLIARPGSRWDRPARVLRNPLFTTEARRMAQLYAADPSADARA